jgi:hypothetical protein
MIKASELIEQLQKAIAAKGDLPVLIHSKGFGGREVSAINKTQTSSISTYDIEESISDANWNLLFPGIEQENAIEEEEKKIDCIEIVTGESIYTT